MKWLIWPALDRFRDYGLLVARVLLGAMMVGHGWPKLIDPSRWPKLGAAMANLGIDFFPGFWGGSAAIAETLGGALVALGLFTRPAATIVAITMFVAWWMHFSGGDPFRTWSHSAEVGMAFTIFIFVGAGRFGLDTLLRRS